MRNLSSSATFCAELENILDEFITSSSTEVLSRITPSVRDPRFENQFSISLRTQENLICLSLLSYYMPEEIGVILRMSISEEIQKTDLDFLELLLKGKGQALCFLLDTSLWHSRDFFGNIVTPNNLKQSILSFRPKMQTRRRPKRVQRHRGYRDKGTLRRDSDKHDLWYSTAEQLEIEEERESQAHTLKFLEGWIT